MRTSPDVPQTVGSAPSPHHAGPATPMAAAPSIVHAAWQLARPDVDTTEPIQHAIISLHPTVSGSVHVDLDHARTVRTLQLAGSEDRVDANRTLAVTAKVELTIDADGTGRVNGTLARAEGAEATLILTIQNGVTVRGICVEQDDDRSTPWAVTGVRDPRDGEYLLEFVRRAGAAA